jgi:hypothetical protein
MSLSTLRTLLQRLLVVALVLGVAIGLRAAGPSSADPTGWRADVLVDRIESVAIVLVAVLVLPSLVLLLWARGEGSAPRPVRRRRSTVSVLLVFALTLAVALWLADPRPWQHRQVHPPAAVEQVPEPVAPTAAREHRSPPWLALSGLAVVTVTAAALSSRRRRTEEDAEPEVLETAVEEPGWHAGARAAAEALRSRPQDPPRSRVLSAYEAFEAALAEQGVVRGASGTATGLLDRAVAEGFPAADALRLTELFSAARYGDQPVTAEDVTAAERSLSSVLAAT